MRVILCGANPSVRLFDGDTVTAYASVWQVDWSERGAGRAIVLWHEGGVRVLADDFPLDGMPHGLRLVIAPAEAATITVGRRRLPGTVTRAGSPERPSSSAFLTTAEVWLR